MVWPQVPQQSAAGSLVSLAVPRAEAFPAATAAALHSKTHYKYTWYFVRKLHAGMIQPPGSTDETRTERGHNCLYPLRIWA